MKPTGRNNLRHGLTIIELLVVVATLCLLVLLFLPSLATTNCKAPLTACGSQLKQMALAQIVWANDHDATNTFLAQRSTPTSLPDFYRALSNELINPRILACPSDSRKPSEDFASLTTNHLSYFVNMDAKSGADSSTALHGDRHITFNPAMRGPIVALTTNLSLGWTRKLGHGSVGNVSFADGSVMKTTDRDLTESLLAPSRVSVQRLLFP